MQSFPEGTPNLNHIPDLAALIFRYFFVCDQRIVNAFRWTMCADMRRHADSHMAYNLCVL